MRPGPGVEGPEGKPGGGGVRSAGEAWGGAGPAVRVPAVECLFRSEAGRAEAPWQSCLSDALGRGRLGGWRV